MLPVNSELEFNFWQIHGENIIFLLTNFPFERTLLDPKALKRN